jgi:hypothetical protein
MLGDTKIQQNPIDDFKKGKIVTLKKPENLEKAMSRPFVAKTVRIRE